MEKGAFVISLDFELCFGVGAKISEKKYQDNVLAVWSIVPQLLTLFKEYNIHVTWATVGFLFFDNKNDLLAGLPKKIPAYSNDKISPYHIVKNINENGKDNALYFAPSLIRLISSYPNQEIATHTFSHYICLDPGQNANDFREDLKAAISIAKRFNKNIKSIVFPFNQTNPQYLAICKEMGITSYRGNEASWIYNIKKSGPESIIRRIFRLADSYINISGHNTHSLDSSTITIPVNIPSSRFLRPVMQRFRFLNKLRMKRILSSLDYAAKNNSVYHLWWHPRNFGTGKDIEENIKFLREILNRFTFLKKEYGMESLTMEELTNNVLSK